LEIDVTNADGDKDGLLSTICGYMSEDGFTLVTRKYRSTTAKDKKTLSDRAKPVRCTGRTDKERAKGKKEKHEGTRSNSNDKRAHSI
jgi:hypothetical protein